jgi:hypothetical protein
MTAVEQHIAIGHARRVDEQAITYSAAIDEPVSQIALRARERRQADPTPQAQRPALYHYRHTSTGKLIAHHLCHAR